MDSKKHKWTWQCWKKAPTWDPVLLPRPSPSSIIRSMKCYQSMYIVILSDQSNIEIWNSRQGLIVYNACFQSSIISIDFYDIYRRQCTVLDDIKEWTLILANQTGDIATTNCNVTESSIELSKVNLHPIKDCFYKLISDTKTIVLIGKEILILNCNDLQTINRLIIAETNNIDVAIFLNDNVIISSSERFIVFSEILTENGLINQYSTKDSHKSPILELIDIDSIYMASISWDKVVIWKRPHFNLTRVFNLSPEILSGNIAQGERVLSCLVHNSRYLIVCLNSALAMFDCTTGAPVTEASCVSDSPIIKILYLDWLSMLLTISRDGKVRFWAFQLMDSTNSESMKTSSPFSPRSFSFTSFSRQTSLKDQSQLSFLGKSFEKEKDRCPLVCFAELEISVQSRDHFVNLEDIGMLTNDGSSTLILWRNRDYAFNNLIQLLQI